MVALENGEVYAWGYNGNGQLGLGNNINQLNACKITNLQGIVITKVSIISFVFIEIFQNYMYKSGENHSISFYFQSIGCVWLCSHHGTLRRRASICMGSQFIRSTGDRKQIELLYPNSSVRRFGSNRWYSSFPLQPHQVKNSNTTLIEFCIPV